MEKQFSDQLPTGPISIGNRDCEANKINIDFGDLIIKVEESQKIKKTSESGEALPDKEETWNTSRI